VDKSKTESLRALLQDLQASLSGFEAHDRQPGLDVPITFDNPNPPMSEELAARCRAAGVNSYRTTSAIMQLKDKLAQLNG
jgi:hypothetical protein